MAARPRKYKHHVANLYQKTDKRNGKTYFTYKHPESGQFIGLGSDREQAFAAATEANQIFAERKADQIYRILQQDEKVVKVTGLSAKEWTKRYIAIQETRLKNGELKPETVRTKVYRAGLFGERFSNRSIKDITTKDIATVLDEYKSQGKDGMARNVRNSWKDMYLEAQYAGEVDSGFNPVMTTRSVSVTPQRARITNDDMIAIMNTKIYKERHHFRVAVKLAITTGLRRFDIVNLKFSDVKDGYLFVSLSKSNGKTKLAFPLELTNPFLNQSLGDIIKECRGTRVVSQYLVHHTKHHTSRNKTKKGQKIEPTSLTTMFYGARKSCSPDISNKNFSLHELRSFAERTYREAGHDTKTLLGHRSQETTDTYNDTRDHQYTFIKLPSTM
ncbi:phage integrase Arm DNA-binding domain-containing protein [Vibrio rhizosphaerae]|uniref:Phage integrase Arm DNA-binding domain-containing protein n=1 Tax=Vibrio rhizosphaerae TaxID=398736 RepID=A0ABU4J0G7_9VIBR|nr:phage integrase Arm DNA-binding domain-containing protein [Vibrio rhizosphaerae]MDW6094009.1 phage integrase Arm DNA-binding domain-containing protein [Vibrio rhizosphaerae]